MSLKLSTWKRSLFSGAIGLIAALPFEPLTAFEAKDASTVYEAHMKAFYKERGESAVLRESTEGGLVSYWMFAEQMEMVLDAYERSKEGKQLEEFSALFKGFLSVHGRVDSYNQGTFVGAADLLGFHEEARLAVEYTMKALCRNGYFPPAHGKGDGGGFNGIAARWIARFIYDHGREKAFEPWLRKNAEAAWVGRRKSDNLSWSSWPKPTPEGQRFSWGNSSAVVFLQVVKPTPTKETE
jgi:hypothetical protein